MGLHGGLSLIVVLALLALDASLLGTFVRAVAHLCEKNHYYCVLVKTSRSHTVTLVARVVPLLPSRHPRLLECVVSACEASVAPVLLTLPDVGSRLRASGGGQIP